MKYGAFEKRSEKMAVQSVRCYEAFDLGLGHWTEEPEETSVQPPPKKRLRLSLGKEARILREHHKSEPVSTAELENAAKGSSSSTDAVPSDLLMSHDRFVHFAFPSLLHLCIVFKCCLNYEPY